MPLQTPCPGLGLQVVSVRHPGSCFSCCSMGGIAMQHCDVEVPECSSPGGSKGSVPYRCPLSSRWRSCMVLQVILAQILLGPTQGQGHSRERNTRCPSSSFSRQSCNNLTQHGASNLHEQTTPSQKQPRTTTNRQNIRLVCRMEWPGCTARQGDTTRCVAGQRACQEAVGWSAGNKCAPGK